MQPSGRALGRRDRDPSSFEDAFAHLLPFAFNVGWRFFRGDRQLAEDIAQETMTRAFVAWGKVKAHPKPEAWITTTALHVALEVYRRNGRARRPIPTDLTATAPDEEGRVVVSDELARAMKKLSVRQQQVLVWRYYFDYSVENTAAVLGLTDSKVKDATHEATNKLARVVRSDRVSDR